MSFERRLYQAKEQVYYHQPRYAMLRFVPLDVNSVLDVGCSSGGFGKILKDTRGCEVWGIEPTESAFVAVNHLDKVYHDVFHHDLNFGDKKFDAIIFNDVLEHLESPWDALDLSKSLLQEKGYVVASIPNVQCYTVVRDLLLKGD